FEAPSRRSSSSDQDQDSHPLLELRDQESRPCLRAACRWHAAMVVGPLEAQAQDRAAARADLAQRADWACAGRFRHPIRAEPRRADVMAHQARVWEALMDLLPALAGDRTTQYAILFRLKRETDTGPDQPPFVPPQLQDTYERLLALMRRTDDKGPVLRENSRPL